MTLLYASTFTDALARLAHQEQKQVKLTAFDLQFDPKGNGLQMHRIENSPGFWSVRVSRDLRIIVHKEGERTLLAYVDHHDPAYRWAERKRLIKHERTGAMQFVEIPVTKDRGFPDWHSNPPDAVARLVSSSSVSETGARDRRAGNRLFAALSDDQ